MHQTTPPHRLQRLCLGAATLLLGAGLGLGLADPAHAQGAARVYRCATGQYSQMPCPAGQALAVDPAPDAAQQREAEAIATRERRLAERLRKDRQAREQAAAKQQPVRIGPPESASSSAHAPHRKPAKAKRPQQPASAAAPQDEPKSRRAYGLEAKP